MQPLSLRLLSTKLKAAAAQNGPEQPSTIIFNSADALQIGSNEAASLVVLETSSLENAETDDTVTVSLVFTDGSSTPFQPAATGLEARTAQEVEIRHAADKALQSVSVQLSGNDAVHFSEVRVEYGFGGRFAAEYSWFLSSSADGGVSGQREFAVAEASPALEYGALPTTRLWLTTQTGTRNNAQTSATILVTFFFEGGHVPPQILSSGFGNGDRDEFVFDLPSGSQRLTAVKIGNTGNDGWRLDTLSVRHRGATTQWPCDEW